MARIGRVIAWKNDEDPQARAKTVVDGILAEMKGSNLI
jgi:hypothetical protein